MTSRGPQLLALALPDDAAAWTAAGFTVVDTDGGGRVRIGSTDVLLGVDGPIRWALEGVTSPSVVGIDLVAPPLGDLPTAHAPDPAHPNGVVSIDHVVLATSNLDATVDALVAGGFDLRRVRDVPGTNPPRRQAFVWAGDVILEIVGAATPEPGASGDATVWGLALTCGDLDATAATLGDAVSTPKTAVQPGRRIATLRTRDLGISLPIALMSGHSPV